MSCLRIYRRIHEILILLLFIVILVLPATAPVQAQKRIGTVIHLEHPIDIVVPPGADPTEVFWAEELGVDGSPWVMIHFTRFDFPEMSANGGARGRLEFLDPSGNITVPYDGIGPERLLTDEGFWTDRFAVDKLTLLLYGDPDRAVGFRIDRFAYGDPYEEERDPAAACLKDVKCLEATDNRYIKAKPVARLRIEYSDGVNTYIYACTGFLYKLPGEATPATNRVMTAEHCFPWTNPKTLTAEFMAERPACKDPPDNNKDCPGTSFAGEKLRWHKKCDVAVFKTGGTPGTTYGMLEIKDECGLTTESSLYMPQHPDYRCKEYSEGNYIGEFKNKSQKCCSFKHGCCGEDGSSGCPIIDKSDYKVVGIFEGKVVGENEFSATRASIAIKWLGEGGGGGVLAALQSCPPPCDCDLGIYNSSTDGHWPGGSGVVDTTSMAVFTFDGGIQGDSMGWTGGNLNPFWAEPPEDNAGLFQGYTTLQTDECRQNSTWFWGFFNGSMETYVCGGYPFQATVPNSFDGYELHSPKIPLSGSGSEVLLKFDLYRDLSLERLIFYEWKVRSLFGDTVRNWRKPDFCYYGALGAGHTGDWTTLKHEIGSLIEPGATHVEIVLRAVNMVDEWDGILGDGSCHSHAPLIDNVEVLRINRTGPVWSVRDIDLFQDNFAADGTVTGTVRIDAAVDILSRSTPVIVPGDSAVVMVSEPVVGLADHMGAGSGPAVYIHVRELPGKAASAVSGDPARWPLVSSSDGWTVLRCDSVHFDADDHSDPMDNRFCVDLNDTLYTPGDTVFFYFSARDANGITSYWSQYTNATLSESEVRAAPMEMTCLPANALNLATDILYVDDFDDRGADPVFRSAFEFLGVTPDRYDVRGASSLMGNGPGSRVVDVFEQMIPYYRKIIWNSGNLLNGTIGDGTGRPEKSNDFWLLFSFLDQHADASGAGVYISGDDIAEEWAGLTSGTAAAFKSIFMPHNLVSGDQRSPVDHGMSPKIIAEPGGMFDHSPSDMDTIIALGGCPIMNDFDVISPNGGSRIEMTYGTPGDPGAGAVLSNDTTNVLGNPVGVVLSGFSFHSIGDDKPGSQFHGTIPDRVQHLIDIIRWLGNPLGDPSSVPSDLRPFKNDLAQNYPNPFNPSTVIKYSVKNRTHASLKIYNVAGQLVKTLVNEEKMPGVYTMRWNGENNAGDAVTSGVYFYRLATKDFKKTKKLVVLK